MWELGGHWVQRIVDRWLLEDYSYCKAGLAKGCNLTATESALVEMVTAGARSRSLLGWYTCVWQRLPLA